MAMDIESQEQSGSWVVKPKGEVDLYSSPQLRKAILQAVSKAKESVVVDLSAVEYMDSSGVATLVEGLKAAEKQKRNFTLSTPSQPVLKVLQLARLDSVFNIEGGAP